MRKVLLMVAFLAVLCVGLAMAQDDTTGVDPAIVQIILTAGIGGIGVKALAELLKRMLIGWLPTVSAKLLGYASAALTSAAATAAYFIAAGGFNWGAFLGYTVAVFLLATGLYKSQPKPS